MRLPKYSVKTFTEIYLEDKKWVFLSNKQRIQWDLNIIVLGVAADILPEKNINKIVGGCHLQNKWENSRLINFIIFLPKNVCVNLGI